MLVEVTSTDLLAVKWKGEDKAADFYHEWVAVESRIEADTMSQKARMNMLWTQLRQSERVTLAVHRWVDKPIEERTHEELMERFRGWLVDQKEYQNYLRATRRLEQNKPKNALAVQEEVVDKKKKGRKPKNKKKDTDGPGSIAALSSASAAKGDGKGKRPKSKCLNFQEKYGMKGCTRKKCPCAKRRRSSRRCWTRLL